jgi:hypothetical protein
MDECAAALECVSQFALKTSSDYKKFQICQSVGPGKQVISAHQRDLIAVRTVEEDSLGEELAPTHWYLGKNLLIFLGVLPNIVNIPSLHKIRLSGGI